MALYKGFRVEIVDGSGIDATVVADLGNFIISFFQTSGTYGSGRFAASGPDFAVTEGLAVETGYIGGVNLAGDPNNVAFPMSLNALQTICPSCVSKPLLIEDYYGNYLRFRNDSGFYMISHSPLTTNPTSTSYASITMDLRDDFGEVMLQSSSHIHVYAFGTTSVCIGSMCLWTANIDSNDRITDLYCYFSGWGERYSAGSSNYLVTYGTVKMYNSKNSIIRFFNGCHQSVPGEQTDPYSGGGNTIPSTPTGQWDDTSDPINIPTLPTGPTGNVTDTGFITIFNPTRTELRSLASYMWSSGFDISTLQKLFADPMDCILGLSIVPCDVPSEGTDTVKVGNISTGISMHKASSQFVEVDCGSVQVNNYWGGYLDYDPYTKIELYLPYIGTHAISADDVMGKLINVVYHIDILSGACVAFVKCGDSVLYQFIGQCAASIPISGNDWTNVINGVLNVAGSIGTMVATGGATAPLAAANVAATAVNGFKQNVEKSGSMSGAGGLMSIQKPYLILTLPRQALPVEQNKFTGYPSFITSSLNSLSGYTEVEFIHLENIPCTGEEQEEILKLLKEGVIL